MKIWKLTIEDAKGKAKGQFFTTIKSSNGETTHSGETIKMRSNAKRTLLALVKAIKEDRFKIIDNSKPKK